MEKMNNFLRSMNALQLEVDDSIVKDVKKICIEAIREQSVRFGLFLMEEQKLTYLKKDCWGIEKDGSIELEEKEYTTEEVYDSIFEQLTRDK